MNATRVSNRAWRKPGITITVILLALAALRQGRAAEINYTITGVLTGGWDQLGIFATGKEAQNMGGKPFTLVFTFDDSKGEGKADRDSSSLSGSGRESGAKAVLTMGSGSFTFGGDKYCTWSVHRSAGFILVFIDQTKGSFFNIAPGVDVRIIPAAGSRTSFGPDWKAPLSTTAIDNQTSCFIITQPDKPNREVKACFDIKKVEVSGGKSWWRPF